MIDRAQLKIDAHTLAWAALACIDANDRKNSKEKSSSYDKHY